MLVHLDCYSKIPQTRWLTNNRTFFLEAGSLTSGCQHAWLRAVSLNQHGLSSIRVPTPLRRAPSHDLSTSHRPHSLTLSQWGLVSTREFWGDTKFGHSAYKRAVWPTRLSSAQNQQSAHLSWRCWTGAPVFSSPELGFPVFPPQLWMPPGAWYLSLPCGHRLPLHCCQTLPKTLAAFTLYHSFYRISNTERQGTLSLLSLSTLPLSFFLISCSHYQTEDFPICPCIHWPAQQ